MCEWVAQQCFLHCFAHSKAFYFLFFLPLFLHLGLYLLCNIFLLISCHCLPPLLTTSIALCVSLLLCLPLWVLLLQCLWLLRLLLQWSSWPHKSPWPALWPECRRAVSRKSIQGHAHTFSKADIHVWRQLNPLYIKMSTNLCKAAVHFQNLISLLTSQIFSLKSVKRATFHHIYCQCSEIVHILPNIYTLWLAALNTPFLTLYSGFSSWMSVCCHGDGSAKACCPDPVLSVHWREKMWPDAVSWFTTRLSGEMQLCRDPAVCLALVKRGASLLPSRLDASQMKNRWRFKPWTFCLCF